MSESFAEADSAEPGLNVAYFGTTGAFSLPPFEALLGAGMRVRAVVLPALADDAPPIAARPARPASPRAHRHALPLLTPFLERSIASLAAERAISVFEVSRLAHHETLATLRALEADVICVACFPRRLPPALLAVPRLGCLNLHPSLLPDNRGPDPLFWTFHRGDRETGITLHRMDSGLDTGPILAQERVAVLPGTPESALERELAARGGELLVQVLRRLAAGTARSESQDERQATTFSWPTAADFVITPSWPARRAFAFAAGISGRAQPVMIQAGGEVFVVRKVLGYDESDHDGDLLGAAWRLDGDRLELRCSPGVLRARVAMPRDGSAGGSN